MSTAQILLVDDHEDTRMIVSRMLKMKGYEVLGAESKAAALAILREQPVDLLISDLSLPDGTGLDLMKAIAAERPVKGIVLSGYGAAEDVERSRAAGFQEHLTKPVDFMVLDETVRKILAQS